VIRSLFSGDKPVVLAVLLAVVIAVTLLQILLMPPEAEGTPFVGTVAPALERSAQRRRPPATRLGPGQTRRELAPAPVAAAPTATRSIVPSAGGDEVAPPAVARPATVQEPAHRTPVRGEDPGRNVVAEGTRQAASASDINPSGPGVVAVQREAAEPAPATAFMAPAPPVATPAVPAGVPVPEPIPAPPGGPSASAPPSQAGEPPLQTDVTPDLDAEGARLVVLGPSSASPGDLLTYLVSTENATNVSHAPLQIVYDPEILEFVEAKEGSLMSAGGTPTFFMASAGSTPGLIHIALSRMPPAGGIDGSGVLCSLIFRARRAGESPIITAGSRLLDQSAHPVDLRRNDSHVAIR